ncbi:putative beta-lysine N-acetyltransferase [Zobellia sp. 1_MG-2023]|uniref:putative beta-lysine N-acetyltransferase n=1 Tax=Zobellia sp. 1_MG-2023 TaxID=3062626 RepID=UPI0026E48DA1|nr:putative beta-lysine N-acetyltransferase [Zobellia sp. 1_MG-2023]MDO6818674.1 putative beta-lysine N-acetyltransferase [Zobellia sp. 1_MG-2023]
MFDTLEKINGATLQHGRAHNRVYLMDTEQYNWDLLIENMKTIAHKKEYDKILSRVPEEAIEVFKSKGYTVEAKIPKLYNGEQAGYFLADYLSTERANSPSQVKKTITSVKTIALAANSSSEDAFFALPDHLEIRKLGEKDLPSIIRLHEMAFQSYPFPIHDPEYLKQLLQENHEFYGLFENDALLVSAILKIQENESSVEIMDFATHPNYNGQNLNYYLVQEIKQRVSSNKYKTLYALVRATSYGLNITFSKHGFILGGTLMNNTVIRGNLESMNVWYCNLSEA